VYEAIRDDDGVLAQEHRALLDAQWRVARPYLDSNFRSAFSRQTAQRFWELRLINALLVEGFVLEPAAENRPDVATRLPDGRRLWIEATAPTLGSEDNSDRPRLAPTGRAVHAVPTVKVMLRLSQGVWDKTRRFRAYRAHGVVADGDVTVIALSAAGLFPFIEAPHCPRILDVLFALGDQHWLVDLKTDTVLRVEHARRVAVAKANGELVAMTAFDSPGHSDISGLIYDFARPRGPRQQEFGRFCTVGNPYASEPLPRGWLPLGDEWLVEGGGLVCSGIDVRPKS
jgi:hypothetical protein